MNQEIISSSKNLAVKQVRKLIESGKYRREQGLAVAEGAHLVASLLQADTLIEQVIYSQSALNNQETIGLIQQIDQAQRADVVLKDELFESLSNIHAAVGLLVVFRPPEQTEPPELISDGLLLEDVQDPGNLGTILRTAAAAGVSKVYLSSGTSSAWSPKALRAGMGAQFSLDIYENSNLLELADKSSIPVLATDLSGKKSLYETDLSAQSAWVFGNEGQGVSPELLTACSQAVKIPQVETTVESLNVSAAVAVCLFEQQRQRSAGEL